MSVWGEVFLGIIAFATLITSILQIGVLVAAGLLARRLHRLVDRLEQELKPVFGHLDSIGRDAARVASVATVQVERLDQAIGNVAQRIDQTLNTVQNAMGIPAREGAALLAGFRAILGALRVPGGRRSRTRGDDEDALFI